MRKILTVLLAFAMLLSMAACGGAPAGEEALPTTEPKRDYSEFAGIVENTKSWYDQLMAMPIATNFTMLSAQYDRDQTLAAASIFMTTLLSVITIPILVGILNM